MPPPAASWRVDDAGCPYWYAEPGKSCLPLPDSGGACPYPLEALGPWNEAKACWPSTEVFFECADGPDGGTMFTCFVRISTGEFFLASTTQIPTGSDYRACTSAESGAHSAYSRCE
ncbi:MAG: hypothetical protein HYV09_32355 [Deltaproteobacteria bacterium]|nr:hypothetical protein [Deltaproteobacteria bacterium]